MLSDIIQWPRPSLVVRNLVIECSLSKRSPLRALVNCRMSLSPFSNVYGKRLQGSYAGACGFQTRILQVEEMSNTGENNDDIDICSAAGLKSPLTVKAESFLTKPEVIVD